jgi:hypothetical protein
MNIYYHQALLYFYHDNIDYNIMPIATIVTDSNDSTFNLQWLIYPWPHVIEEIGALWCTILDVWHNWIAFKHILQYEYSYYKVTSTFYHNVTTKT